MYSNGCSSTISCTSCVIARRTAIEDAGYMQPHLRFAQDWDLWLKIACKHHVDLVPASASLPAVRNWMPHARHALRGSLARTPTHSRERATAAACVSNVRTARSKRAQMLWAVNWLQESRNPKPCPMFASHVSNTTKQSLSQTIDVLRCAD